ARLARDEAQRANQAKSTFLANMSHELRTPLNAILGFAEVLQQDPSLGPLQREHTAIITRSGEQLLHLLNDILEMSKIEAGKAQLHQAAFSLRAMLATAQKMFAAAAQDKGIVLHLDLSPTLPRYAEGDEAKLRQVIINLLSNAIKFTEQGSVTLRASHHAGRLSISVADTGVGIAPEEQSALFEPFSQTSSGVRSQKGTGLGAGDLSTVRADAWRQHHRGKRPRTRHRDGL
ncbi:MAG: sensor histidine kinase, partial [Anaerolineae bacterium]|nr:sensor histidine kinase [Anaerolineae bacterium]